MKKQKRNVPLLTRRQLDVIDQAIERLEALADPQNTRCAVDPAAKKAVSNYLRSWVIPKLRALREHSVFQMDWEFWWGG